MTASGWSQDDNQHAIIVHASHLLSVRPNVMLAPFSHFVANVEYLFRDTTQHVCAILQVTSAATDRPKPVYKSTACQLGIHKTPGVWPLLDSLLSPTPTSLLVRRWLRRLLLLPPPTEVAKSIRTACQFLSGNSHVPAAACAISQ